jgi:hypothetical protein
MCLPFAGASLPKDHLLPSIVAPTASEISIAQQPDKTNLLNIGSAIVFQIPRYNPGRINRHQVIHCGGTLGQRESVSINCCHVQTLWSASRHLSSGLGSKFRFHVIDPGRSVCGQQSSSTVVLTKHKHPRHRHCEPLYFGEAIYTLRTTNPSIQTHS